MSTSVTLKSVDYFCTKRDHYSHCTDIGYCKIILQILSTTLQNSTIPRRIKFHVHVIGFDWFTLTLTTLITQLVNLNSCSPVILSIFNLIIIVVVFVVVVVVVVVTVCKYKIMSNT